jgi:hypothetical protein
MAYANGRRALGQCDRCGQRYLLKELHNEWNGLKTCPECWEPKQPQLEVRLNFADPQALYEPRPDKDVPAGDGLVRTTKVNAFNSLVVDPIGTALAFSSINGSVGTVTVVTT